MTDFNAHKWDTDNVSRGKIQISHIWGGSQTLRDISEVFLAWVAVPHINSDLICFQPSFLNAAGTDHPETVTHMDKFTQLSMAL